MTRVGNPWPAQLRACSGCAGDYEDPERTAERGVDEEEDGEPADAGAMEQSVARERVPVRQR
jgi:hypothetical protein